jgi:hypothetical protein
MSQASTPTLASWSAPSWAETSERDDEALIHSRSIGVLHDLDGDALSVDVVQRDEMIFAPGYASVERTPAYVRVAGQRMDGRQAALLSQLLTTASDLATETSAQDTEDTHPRQWPSHWPLVLVTRPSESGRALP